MNELDLLIQIKQIRNPSVKEENPAKIGDVLRITRCNLDLREKGEGAIGG